MSDRCRRLLVVDDNEMNRDMLSRRLSRKGYDVALAEDGAAALQTVAAAGPFDLIVLDIMMPGIDGFEVLRQLRQQYAATELPVIMATAKDDREDIVRALQLGANDYVTKPLDFAVVLARVETQLSLKSAVDQIRALERDLAKKNADLQSANERMAHDLAAAARLQHALLPARLPETGGFELAWRYQPCDELAGDILNVFAIDERHLGLYILDVSGHGVPAALLSVTLSRMLTPVADQSSLVQRRAGGNGALEPTPPAEVAAELNRRFQVDLETGQYFTMQYGVLDTHTRELRLVGAGHPGPLHVGADGEPVNLFIRSFPIGWVPEVVYPEKVLTLRAGDRLLFYSDGISEAMNPAKEQFGEQRLAQLFAESRTAPLGTVIDALLAQVRRWTGGGFGDDVSLLALATPPRGVTG